MHAWAFANFSAPSLLVTAVVVHTLGYLLTTALVAIVVYEKLGVGDIAPRVVQHRFGLDARADDYRRLYPALLICGWLTSLHVEVLSAEGAFHCQPRATPQD